MIEHHRGFQTWLVRNPAQPLQLSKFLCSIFLLLQTCHLGKSSRSASLQSITFEHLSVQCQPGSQCGGPSSHPRKYSRYYFKLVHMWNPGIGYIADHLTGFAFCFCGASTVIISVAPFLFLASHISNNMGVLSQFFFSHYPFLKENPLYLKWLSSLYIRYFWQYLPRC
jgi:hypothetical protein